MGLILLVLSPGGYLSLEGQTLLINEIMSSNSGVVLDEYGEASDWVEIYNSNTSAFDLKGCYLSDNPANLQKWAFPNLSVPGQGHLLIFASGKDRGLYAKHWETIIDRGDEWRYFPGTSEPDSNWHQPGFIDSTWSTGNSGFGYGDGDDATLISGLTSIYIRREFDISSLLNIETFILHIDADDGFIAWLNGVEIARKNMYAPGSFVAHNQVSQFENEAQLYQGNLPWVCYIKKTNDYLVEGTNVIAIQGNNISPFSSDQSLIPMVTLGMDTLPANPAGVPTYIEAQIPRIHSDFKLSSVGETLTLSDSLGHIIDQVNFLDIPYPLSYGREIDGDTNWCFTNQPSPGTANQTGQCMGLCPKVEFSVPGGFYDSSLSLILSGNPPGDAIFFTTDGSEPTPASSQYTNPIPINAVMIVRARILNPLKFPGKTVSHSYFINQSFDLPVVSISTDPNNLWHTDTGMLVMGNNASYVYPYYGANFWQDWERPVHIDFFEQDSSLTFSLDAGIKVYGGWTRAFAQKSLAVFFRKKYGFSNLSYTMFPEKPIDKFENLVFRNSGNDWAITMFRDGMMTGLLRKLDMDIQAFRPAILFLNGEFYGIQNIREKINEHFIAANHPLVDKDNIDLLELEDSVIVGDNLSYHQMLDFITNNPLSLQGNYEEVKTMMDVENFALYQLSNIYFDNLDWPGNNIKFWRTRTFDGKFRWILFDTDFGFGFFGGYNSNTLEMALDPNGDPEWPNPPWSTFLFRKLAENDEFKNMFINRFADCLNYSFQKDTVMALINSTAAQIESSMPLHFAKYGGTLSTWESEVQVLRTFAFYRAANMRGFIMDEFQLQNGLYNFTVSSNVAGAGNIRVNSLSLETFPWSGIYFQDVPVEVWPMPNPGFVFQGWTGDTITGQDTLVLSPGGNFSMIANYIPVPVVPTTLVINEFMASNATDTADNFGDHDDWIEIYNPGSTTIDVAGWYISDEISEPDKFQITSGTSSTIISPGEYKVFWADKEPEQGADHLNIKLSANGEAIILSQASSGTFYVVDSISFGVQSSNISMGRSPDASPTWIFFTTSTPGASNYLQAVQSIAFLPGWSYFSNYVIPANPLLDSVLFDIIAHVVIVKNQTGQVYWPYFNLNLIGNMETGFGYQIKFSQADTLYIMGLQVVPETFPISIPSGWSLIGYLRNTSAPIFNMLLPIAQDIIIVKDSNGSVFWPLFNLDAIGNMHPGNAYLLKMISPHIYSYPPN